jgi:hypothetical protein
MHEPSQHTLLAAVVHADETKLESGGISSGTALHLVSAREKLQVLVLQDPNSELAKEVADLLNQEKLFELVGKWPPDQSEEGPPVSSTTPLKGRYCRHCGAKNP